MSRRQRLILRLIKLLPPLVVLIIGGVYIGRQIQILAKHANVIFSQELAIRFDREVKIGKVEITPLGSAVLEDVEIAAEKKLSQGRMISVKKIVVHYNWRALLCKKKGAEAVDLVEVIDPTLELVRRKDGTFNIQDLLKPVPGPRRPPFRGNVSIVGGKAVFKDFLAKTGHKPEVNYVKDLDGNLDAFEYPRYRFSLTAHGGKGRFKTVNAVGEYDSVAKSVKVDVDGSDLAPGYWTRYLGILRGLPITGGTARVTMGVNYLHPQGRAAQMRLTGTIRGSGLTARFPGIHTPIHDTSGRVVLAGNRAVFSFDGSTAGSKLQVTGAVDDIRSPKLDVFITSPSTDYAGLMKAVDLPAAAKQVRIIGRGPVRARVTGVPSDPVVNIVADIPRVSAQGYTASGVSIAGIYNKKKFAVRSLHLRIKGARVAALGDVDLGPIPSANIKGRISGFQLSALPVPGKVKASGIAGATFSASGTIDNPRVSLTADISNGRVNNIPFRSAHTRLSVVDRRAHIDGLRVSGLAGGVVTVSGAASGQAVDLKVHAESVDLSKAAAMLGRRGIGGVAFFDGRISGRIADPRVAGKLDIFRGHYFDNNINYARAVFSGDMHGVKIDEAIVRLFPGELKLAGTVKGLDTGRIAFDGQAHVANLNTKTLMSLLKRDLKVTGSIIGDFKGSGVFLTKTRPGESPFLNTTASGELRVEDGTAFGYPISSASTTLRFADNQLAIQQAKVSSESAEVELSGSVRADTRALDLSFKLSGFDLARIRDRVEGYVLLGGMASASGTISGTLNEISVSVDGGVDNLVLNNKLFDKASLQASYADGIFSTFGATFKRGSQVYTLSGRDYDLKTNRMASAKGEFKDVSVPDFWDILRASPSLASSDEDESLASPDKLHASLEKIPRLTGGSLNGTVELNGCVSKPNGSLDLTAKNVGIDVQKIESITLKASAKEGVIKLEQLQAVSGDTNILVTGDPLYADGQVKFDIEANNFDLSHLRPWLGSRTPGGVLSAAFHVRGDYSQPDVFGSVEVINPSYGSLVFDRLRASTIRIASDKIELDDIRLASGSHEVVAKGNIPWDWDSYNIPAKQPLELTANLSNQDLSLLSTFVSQIDPAKTKGPVDGQLQITGTIEKPQMSGWLSVTDGALAMKNFTNTFTAINGNLTFDGDKVVFNHLSANSSLGGSIAVESGGYIQVRGLEDSEINLLAYADKMVVGERDLLGFQEKVGMQVDAGISITGKLPAPEIKDAAVRNIPGGVTISNAKIAFAVPSAMSNHVGFALPVDPKFNISLKLGQNVVVEPPSMSLLVAGGGKLAGRLSAPDMGITLDIRQGSLKLAAARLRVVPGGSIVAHYAPPAAPELRVDFQAATSVMAKNQIGQRERYQINLGATGPIANLHISLSSQPSGLSREQMLAALGHVEGIFTSGELGLEKELGSVLTAVGTSTLFAPIENVFIDKLGFEQFTLESNAGNPLAIYASRRLIDNFYLSLYRRMGAAVPGVKESLYEAILSYKHKRGYSLSVGIDSQQTTTLSIGVTRSF